MSDIKEQPFEGRDADDVLAAELVLRLLEGDERRLAAQRLATDPAFAAQVAAWQERLVPITDDIAPVAPARRVKKKLMKRLFGTAHIPLSERLWVWKGLSFAALALAAFLGIRQLGPEPVPSNLPIYATQLTGEAVALQVLAVLDPAKGEIALSRVAGQPVQGRDFELWAIVSDAAPISLGVLPQDPTVRIALSPALVAQAGQITLAISDEPAGGSPTGAPTGDVLAAAAVTAL